MNDKKPDPNNSQFNETNSEQAQTLLYSFPKQGQGDWRIEDDVVMGGRSDSQLKMTEKDYAHFSGHVSLQNNGGFCSMRLNVEEDPYQIPDQSTAFLLRVKGDGKDYNFRVRTPKGRHSYGYTFSTKSEAGWETISIPFDQMKARFHGEPVNVPNYDGQMVVEMQLLIGNKKEQNFEILVASIEVN